MGLDTCNLNLLFMYTHFKMVYQYMVVFKNVKKYFYSTEKFLTRLVLLKKVFNYLPKMHNYEHLLLIVI